MTDLERLLFREPETGFGSTPPTLADSAGGRRGKFRDRDFVPTESGLTYSSSNQRSDSDVIRVVGLQGGEPENGSIAHLEHGVTATRLCGVQLGHF